MSVLKLAFQYLIECFDVHGMLCCTLDFFIAELSLERLWRARKANFAYGFRFFVRLVFQKGICLDEQYTYKHKADDNTDAYHHLT